jgi:hypothetical protein
VVSAGVLQDIRQIAQDVSSSSSPARAIAAPSSCVCSLSRWSAIPAFVVCALHPSGGAGALVAYRRLAQPGAASAAGRV